MRRTRRACSARSPDGGQYRARCLGSDHRLEVHEVQDPRFDQLRFRKRRRDTQEKLVGEDHRPLGHGVDVPGEAKPRKRLQRGRFEAPGASQRLDLLWRESHVLQKAQHLLESSGEKKVACAR
jgi:hypothetical protein